MSTWCIPYQKYSHKVEQTKEKDSLCQHLYSIETRSWWLSVTHSQGQHLGSALENHMPYYKYYYYLHKTFSLQNSIRTWITIWHLVVSRWKFHRTINGSQYASEICVPIWCLCVLRILTNKYQVGLHMCQYWVYGRIEPLVHLRHQKEKSCIWLGWPWLNKNCKLLDKLQLSIKQQASK